MLSVVILNVVMQSVEGNHEQSYLFVQKGFDTDKHSSLFVRGVSDEESLEKKIDTSSVQHTSLLWEYVLIVINVKFAIS